MPRNRFVEPITVKLPLSDGDWIEVKKELTVVERDRIAGAGLDHMERGAGETDRARFTLNFEGARVVKLVTWIINWSFIDADGKYVPPTAAAIGNLDGATCDEIEKAINDHQGRVTEEKKQMTGMTAPAPASIS